MKQERDSVVSPVAQISGHCNGGKAFWSSMKGYALCPLFEPHLL